MLIRYEAAKIDNAIVSVPSCQLQKWPISGGMAGSPSSEVTFRWLSLPKKVRDWKALERGFDVVRCDLLA